MVTLYSAKTNGKNSWILSKLSEDMEVLDFYVLRKNRNSFTCSCPSHAPYCKHMDILTDFMGRNKIGTGWFLNWDNKKWVEPVSQTED